MPGRQGLREVLRFTAPGTHQFQNASYPWLARVRIRVQAAGGGAAGARANANQCSAQPGGAGGGYSEGVYDVSALGAVETIVVGQGGSAGTASTDGSDGGNSSFGGLVSANGGAGGPSVMTSGTTTVCFSGTPGPLGGSGQIVMGGGAGGGALRLDGGQGLAGVGGGSHLGHGGYQRASTSGGGAGRGYGGGAAGALARDGDSVTGTAGQDGIVIVELLG
ncbi:glycine-rich domain-containing protein [Streptomyces sp. NPDC002309]